MLFLNPLLLIGLLGIAVPIIVHLWSRGARRPVQWGAMHFLRQSLSDRAKRIELEDTLLMGVRCAAAGCLALALARPFVPPGATIPWAAVLPLAVAAMVALAFAAACWGDRRRRWFALGGAGLLAALAIGAVIFERSLSLGRLGGRSETVALVIDASTSMNALDSRGGTRFDAALNEAREIMAAADDDVAFSIYLAGPTPVPLTPSPTSSRRDLERALASAQCSDGGLALPETLTAAGDAMGDGGSGLHRAIFITDGGGDGWRRDDGGAWSLARGAFGKLPKNPQLIVRRIASETGGRNLAVVAIESERGAPTAGRPAEVRVDLINAGSEAVTPDAVTLRVGDDLLENKAIGQLLPGETASVMFDYRFEEGGAYVLSASALVDDDLPADDTRERVFAIGTGPKVLIVDGRPNASGFDRAAAFLELALAPGEGDPAPTVVSAAKLPTGSELSRFDAVILADVPRLAVAAAEQLETWAAAGGGLLIAPGASASVEFYNQWPPTAAFEMSEWATDATIAPTSIDHRVVHEGGDLGSLRAERHWTVTATDPDAAIATFENGSPFLLRAPYGAGAVIVSALPLDRSASNLPSRASFVPLVYELVAVVATGAASGLHLAPSNAIELPAPDLPDGEYGVLDPRGSARSGEATAGLLRVEGEAVAGVYEVGVPPASQELIADLLTATGTLPFTIARPASESQLAINGDPAAGVVSESFDLLEPTNAKDAAAALEGSPFGAELWRTLALIALGLLVAETALARWVTRSRKTGEHEGVEFNTRPQASR